MGDSRVQDVSLVPSTDCREERLALRLLVAELLQMPHEGLWDDLELGDEEPLKVAKRFIYSRKLQPKYFQLLKAYKSLLDSHPLPSQSEMNRNLLTTKMLGNDIVAWPQMPTPSPTLKSQCLYILIYSCCSYFDNMPISDPQKYRMLIVK